MKKTLALATASGLLLAAPTVAQSATASLTAASNTVSPGSSVTVSVVIDFSTGGAGSGAFGMAGLYGFGGDAVASGDAAADTSASSVSTAAFLPLGPVAATNAGSSNIATIAGGR
ncbi:MAG: hypothetical protein AAFY46_01380, partial [Planctomycetota bacterium]